MSKRKQPLFYCPPCGSSMELSCVAAIKLARRYNRPVRLLWNNGVVLRVTKRLTRQHLERQWHEMTAARGARYVRSAEHQSWLAEQAAKQPKFDAAYLMLPAVLAAQDMPRTICWVQAFVDLADKTNVVCAPGQLQNVAEQFQKVGFVADYELGEKPWSRERFGRYIIGQVLRSFLRGAVPPPNVCVRFCDDYLKMPPDEVTMDE